VQSVPLQGVIPITSGGLLCARRSHPRLIAREVVGEVWPGDVVGDAGLLEVEPRTTSVTAITETHAIALGASSVAKALREQTDQRSDTLPTFRGDPRSSNHLARLAARRGWIRPSGGQPVDRESVEERDADQSHGT
jgi:CRP-like cAMP-binding protein